MLQFQGTPVTWFMLLVYVHKVEGLFFCCTIYGIQWHFLRNSMKMSRPSFPKYVQIAPFAQERLGSSPIVVNGSSRKYKPPPLARFWIWENVFSSFLSKNFHFTRFYPYGSILEFFYYFIAIWGHAKKILFTKTVRLTENLFATDSPCKGLSLVFHYIWGFPENSIILSLYGGFRRKKKISKKKMKCWEISFHRIFSPKVWVRNMTVYESSWNFFIISFPCYWTNQNYFVFVFFESSHRYLISQFVIIYWLV